MEYYKPFINHRGEEDAIIPIEVCAALMVNLNPDKANSILRSRLGCLFNPHIPDDQKTTLLCNVLTAQARIAYEKSKEQDNV
jgi:hypothetical protein